MSTKLSKLADLLGAEEEVHEKNGDVSLVFRHVSSSNVKTFHVITLEDSAEPFENRQKLINFIERERNVL